MGVNMHFNPKHIPLIGFWLCALSMPVFAQDNTAGKLHQRANASMCANCHGTEGQTVKDSSVPSIAGLPRDYLVQQISKGLSEEQIASMAEYFAAQPR
jgi:cytochrome c553